MKSRKCVQSALLQTELVELLKHMFYPSRRLIKEQIDWLIEHEYRITPYSAPPQIVAPRGHY